MTEPSKTSPIDLSVRIQTDAQTKQEIKYLLAHYLGKGLPDGYEYLRVIILKLRGNTRIRDAAHANLVLSYGEQGAIAIERRVMVDHVSIKEYKAIQYLGSLVKNAKQYDNRALANQLMVHCYELATRLALVDDAIMKLFVACVAVTDLRDANVPPQDILRAANLGHTPRPYDYQRQPYGQQQGQPAPPTYPGPGGYP